MYKRRLVLLTIGVIASLVTLVFLIVKMFIGSKELLIPIVVVIAYIVYIFTIVIEEYKTCKLDEESGLEEATMELYNVKIFSKKANDGMPALPLVTFKGKGKNYVTLSGDFTKIELIQGEKYRIMFCKHSKMLVNIKKA